MRDGGVPYFLACGRDSCAEARDAAGMPGVRPVDLPGEAQSDARPDLLISELAGRQHGVVARWQLIDMGVTKGHVEGRLARGLFHPIHRGVYAVGNPRISIRGRWLAAVLACGPRAVLSHRSAAALHGLLRVRSSNPHVTVPNARRRRPKGVRVHCSRHLLLADRARVDGIPTTSIPRTLLDLAETADATTLARAFEEADRLRLLRIAELVELRA